MPKALLTFCLAALLAACTPLADRLSLEASPSTLRLTPAVDSIMVRTASLPTYAAIEEIPLQRRNGIIDVREDVLWADDPERAVTLILTKTLGEILGADVGPQPWPFIGLPDVSVDVRVSHMLASVERGFILSGHFYVASEGRRFTNSTHDFSIPVRMESTSLIAISAAQSEALLRLSEQIARTLGRP